MNYACLWTIVKMRWKHMHIWSHICIDLKHVTSNRYNLMYICGLREWGLEKHKVLLQMRVHFCISLRSDDARMRQVSVFTMNLSMFSTLKAPPRIFLLGPGPLYIVRDCCEHGFFLVFQGGRDSSRLERGRTSWGEAWHQAWSCKARLGTSTCTVTSWWCLALGRLGPRWAHFCATLAPPGRHAHGACLGPSRDGVHLVHSKKWDTAIYI